MNEEDKNTLVKQPFPLSNKVTGYVYTKYINYEINCEVIATNRRLKTMGLKDDESCIRFGMNVGSLIHAFSNGSAVAKTVVRDIKR